MRQFVLALLALMVTASAAIAQRLPSGVTPTHYTLWFAPDLDRATFRGRETIDVTLQRPTTTVTLNAAEIDFGNVTIDAGGRRQTARVTLDEKKEMATLTLPHQLPAGRASIQITYTGILNDKLRGFYLSKANNRRYAVTQMEATDARRAFPSWNAHAKDVHLSRGDARRRLRLSERFGGQHPGTRLLDSRQTSAHRVRAGSGG